MTYEDVKGAAKISRDCWRGMWVEKNKIHWVHADQEDRKHDAKFVPSDAELKANDWYVLTDSSLKYWLVTKPLVTAGD